MSVMAPRRFRAAVDGSPRCLPGGSPAPLQRGLAHGLLEAGGTARGPQRSAGRRSLCDSGAGRTPGAGKRWARREARPSGRGAHARVRGRSPGEAGQRIPYGGRRACAGRCACRSRRAVRRGTGPVAGGLPMPSEVAGDRCGGTERMVAGCNDAVGKIDEALAPEESYGERCRSWRMLRQSPCRLGQWRRPPRCRRRPHPSAAWR